MFCFQYKRLLLKLISKYVHDLIVNVLLGVYWFPQSYWWYGMNILKVEFYPPTKGQPYLPKNFVKILNYSNKNTEIQCKFKTRRSIKNWQNVNQRKTNIDLWLGTAFYRWKTRKLCYHQECLVYLGVWLLSGCHFCSKQILCIIAKSAGNYNPLKSWFVTIICRSKTKNSHSIYFLGFFFFCYHYWLNTMILSL